MSKRKFILIFIFTLVLFFSCTVPKEARRFEKDTKEWRKATVVLEGFADTPLNGSFLVLRENKKFERTTSGMFRSFRAGTWSINKDKDTISLSYLDRENNVVEHQEVYIDRENSTLSFEGEEFGPAVMIIITNKLYPNDLEDDY